MAWETRGRGHRSLLSVSLGPWPRGQDLRWKRFYLPKRQPAKTRRSRRPASHVDTLRRWKEAMAEARGER